MRRQTYWLFGTAIALAGLVVICACLIRPAPSRPGVTWANVKRIEVGMTQAQVEAIVGGPSPGWSYGPDPITDNSPPDYHAVMLWSATECDILVYFDRDGRVISREGVGSNGSGWLGWLRARIGL